jgi:hypothetical protein
MAVEAEAATAPELALADTDINWARLLALFVFTCFLFLFFIFGYWVRLIFSSSQFFFFT